MKNLILLIFLTFLSLSCNNKDIRNYNFKSSNEIDRKIIDITLNWIGNSRTDMGGIVIEASENDSIVEIQKYIFYQKGDTIKLSSEFENGVYTYLLKLKDSDELIISPISNNEKAKLFGYNLEKIILRKIENDSLLQK